MDGSQKTERLLSVILDSTPSAMILVGETGRIAFTNAAARQLFFNDQEVTGENFLKMLASASEPLRRPLLSETDHISKRHFTLDDEPHTLIIVKHMTPEISKQEIAVLKKTLRIIGHELG